MPGCECCPSRPRIIVQRFPWAGFDDWYGLLKESGFPELRILSPVSDSSRDCPNCGTRIHPLDLSDLYRGRLLNCSHCGQGLSAQVTGWASGPVGGLVWLGLISVVEAIDGPFWVGVVLGGALASLAVVVVRVALRFEGAPWVRLTARKQPWKPHERSGVSSLFLPR